MYIFCVLFNLPPLSLNFFVQSTRLSKFEQVQLWPPVMALASLCNQVTVCNENRELEKASDKENIRIFNCCEVRIENSVMSVM